MARPVIGITGSIDQSARLGNQALLAVGHVYVRAVELAGGAPVVTPPRPEEEAQRAIFERLDGLILSGGGDIQPAVYGEEDSGLLWWVDEARDRAELMLARWALAEGLPLLGICRGIQVLNVAAGGTLIQDIGTQVPQPLAHCSVASRPMDTIVHTLELAHESTLAAVFGSDHLDTNSAHHQAVKAVGGPLVVTARASDGVIEGVEAPDHPFCMGVQFHPEAMVDAYPQQLRLFEALVGAARARRT